MSSIWTVKPEDVKIDLVYDAPDGSANPFWLRVKRRLSVGEARKVQTAGWQGVSGIGGGAAGENTGPKIDIDWKATAFARATAYIVDWSLLDDKGNKLKIGQATLEALHEDVFELIDQAITAHVEAAEQEKKATSGSREPVTT